MAESLPSPNPREALDPPLAPASDSGLSSPSQDAHLQPPLANIPILPIESGWLTVSDWSSILHGDAFADWVEEKLGGESYGAPRVFDLYTLLAITLAFGLLFAALGLLKPIIGASLPSVVIGVSSFLTGIALAQLTICGGQKSRIASIAAGLPLWQLLWIISLGPSLQPDSGWAVLLTVYLSSFFGMPLGYVSGGAVAGVFLIADQLRKRLTRETPNKPQEDDPEFTVSRW